MSAAPATVVEQAHRLVATARMLPVEEAGRLLEQAVTIIQAAQAEVLIDGERSGALADSGCRGVRGFAQTVLRRSAHDASKTALVARHLVCLPRLAAAYRAGLAHTGNLRAVLDGLSVCGLELLQAYEEPLVDLAVRAGPEEIKAYCAALAEAHRPDADEKKVTAHGSRWVRIARVGDLAHLDAMLDPVLADQLKISLTAMARASDSPGDPRFHGERCADALEDVLRAGMERTDLPKQARRVPHALVQVSLETLLGMAGHGRALLERFGLIPAATAARVACDALVRLVLTHGDRVLNVGTSLRVVNDRQHAALGVLYRTCVMPGCRVKFSDCTIHHLWWYHLGGPTDLDLQVPVCASHHIWLHEGGYSLTREEGRLVFRDPKDRPMPDPDQPLTEQLDLLHQQTPPPTVPADTTGTTGTTGTAGTAGTPGGTVEDILDATDGWPDSPYQHGTWGWSGHNPGPPPGHAPPQRGEAR